MKKKLLSIILWCVTLSILFPSCQNDALAQSDTLWRVFLAYDELDLNLTSYYEDMQKDGAILSEDEETKQNYSCNRAEKLTFPSGESITIIEFDSNEKASDYWKTFGPISYSPFTPYCSVLRINNYVFCNSNDPNSYVHIQNIMNRANLTLPQATESPKEGIWLRKDADFSSEEFVDRMNKLGFTVYYSEVGAAMQKYTFVSPDGNESYALLILPLDTEENFIRYAEECHSIDHLSMVFSRYQDKICNVFFMSPSPDVEEVWDYATRVPSFLENYWYLFPATALVLTVAFSTPLLIKQKKNSH